LRLRTYIVSISALLVLLIIVVISYQTRHILDRGFTELGTAEVRRASEIVRAVIKSKRDGLTSFKKLIAANEEIEEAIKHKRLINELDEIKELGRFDFVDFIFPNGSSVLGNEKQLGSGIHIDETMDSDNFSALEINGKLYLLSFCTKRKSNLGVLVLGHQLSGPFEKRLSDLTGSKVKFVTRPANAKGTTAATISTEDANFFEISRFPLRTLMAQIDLDASIFEKIDSGLRKSLLASGSISLLILLLLLYLVFEIGFVRRFGTILGAIKNASSKLETGAIPHIDHKTHFLSELKWLSRAFSQFSESLSSYDQRNKEQALAAANAERQAALASLAQQVAHDIRSPLAALEMFVDTYDQLPEEPRNMMKGCVARALDVANTLLDKFKSQTSNLEIDDTASLEVTREVVLISSLIEPIVSEKRVQYAKKDGLKIRTAFTAQSYGIFVLLSTLRFKRILSNIIDNAVEAIDGSGEVIIRLSPVGSDKVSILVEDNGRGIPAEVLPKLGGRGTTFGKTTGTGLGLHYAKTVIESVGGTFNIDSTVGLGTKVEGVLERAETPLWFVKKLIVQPETEIIVLDDDPSIHHLWDKRIKSLIPSKTLLHFYKSSELAEWYRQNETSAKPRLYLCDYEFQKERLNGLDVIESLGLQENAVLVTTHFDNKEIQARCAHLGVGLIPKALARFVPLNKV
jgi:signal transduction histidine kinase